ncbi:MAG TPA: transcription antitermination factor NusB [Gemmatimonadaceae bacterium]|nr:transcription antitermination factor NusB [Gemmatimonadaceae bacterium]
MRRRARARAIQALYAWDLAGRLSDVSLESFADRLWSDLAVSRAERDVAYRLINVVQARIEEIDDGIAAATRNWRLGRLGAIERAVLRLGSAELRKGDTPPRVVIQEAVTLAERFGTLESARFVNGVLDAIARQLGSL